MTTATTILAVDRSVAQTAVLPPEKARQALQLLDDPGFRAWLQDQGKSPQEAQAISFADTVAGWSDAVHRQLEGLITAIPRLPGELKTAVDIAAREIRAGQSTVLALILMMLVGFAGEVLARRAMSRRLPGDQSGEGGSRVVLFRDLSALGVFGLAVVMPFLVLRWPPVLHHMALALTAAFLAFRFVRIATRFVIAACSSSPHGQGIDEIVSTRAERFWRRRVDIVAAIVLGGWATVAVLQTLGASPEIARVVALALGLSLLCAAVEIVWNEPAERSSSTSAILHTIAFVLLWILWLAGMPGLLWLGLFAIFLPVTLRGTGKVARALAGATDDDGKSIVFKVILIRGARAAVLVCALGWLAYLWRSGAGILTGTEFGARVVEGLLGAVLVALAADLLWQLSKALIDSRLHADVSSTDDPDAVARAARLRTLLPIFRNVLAAFVAVVASLMILSELGIQIAPLIAGAGVLGVAIGFGSQTLVKDVISGVFYMLDDAFRVGEYIQSGSYKGTVESFSLRSVRLRHHRGPIYTVPFGELGAVQNMSRDWVVEKMIIRVTYDSDVDLARKLVKKIGQELAALPEFAVDTIEPLKMQGIDNFGDFAIELRMKLKTRPGTQFTIKRQAFMMIKKAFAEHGIKIAVPTVHVEGGASSAAAGHQLIQKMETDAAVARA